MYVGLGCVVVLQVYGIRCDSVVAMTTHPGCWLQVNQLSEVANETSSVENREYYIRGGILNINPSTQLAHKIVGELNEGSIIQENLEWRERGGGETIWRGLVKK